MTREELIAFAKNVAPELQEGPSKQFPEVIVAPEKIHELAVALKESSETKMDYLFCETAADRKDGLHMIYHITSSEFQHSILVKSVLTDKENPAIDSVADIWKAAEFFEREIFDLFGIKFNNHPDLRRIFLEDDWVGYPLRKDYKDPFMIDR